MKQNCRAKPDSTGKANLAGKIGVTFDPADDRTYGTTSTRLAKIVIGSRTIGVRVGTFTVTIP